MAGQFIVGRALTERVDRVRSRVFSTAAELAAKEEVFAAESAWRRSEADIALRRWTFMRKGHPMDVAHAHATRGEAGQ